jgi:hypothetical protein
MKNAIARKKTCDYSCIKPQSTRSNSTWAKDEHNTEKVAKEIPKVTRRVRSTSAPTLQKERYTSTLGYRRELTVLCCLFSSTSSTTTTPRDGTFVVFFLSLFHIFWQSGRYIRTVSLSLYYYYSSYILAAIHLELEELEKKKVFRLKEITAPSFMAPPTLSLPRCTMLDIFLCWVMGSCA